MITRYLENYLPSLSYRPSGKGIKRPSEKEKEALISQVGSADESLISALHSISKADRVDVEVSLLGEI